MAPANEILIVDDEVGIRELLSEILQDEGYRVSLAENATEARTYRARQQPALVLLDIWMPDTDGVTLLREWAASGQLTMPVVMMSGHGTIETAVEATKIGAFDFLEKPVGLQKLLGTVARALKTTLAKEPRRVSLAALGTSGPVRDAERAIEQLLAAKKPVLILGEPGAGHDMAARALHLPDAPWLALPSGVRLAANPLSVLEEAREGGLFCAEIGQFAKAEQKGLAFLLPKLERASVTLVCTSAEPLGNLAAEGKFDPALLAALSVGAVLLPPLRTRREDIPALVDRFWRDITAAQKDAERGAVRTVASLPIAALTTLTNAYWPGNVDHLQNVVANLALNAGAGDITPDHVKRLLGESAAANQAVAPEITARFFELPLREAREAFERIYFEQLLGREQSNMSRVADKAGLERTHLYRKLKQLSIRFARRGDDTGGNGNDSSSDTG
jgi:two-component system, NtrC family, nitrogen regulation response regulator NtrX